ncbi:MAG TPA: DUF4157 domain-containing protein [Gemmatimonadales bacterium]|jgi:hypothetical protein|nr:DUF4157 domain-containing protein [Gemmatimonadales bacterium]
MQLRRTAGNAAVGRLSGGQALEPAVRHAHERTFDRDLSSVRVHADRDAAHAALALNARAYTYGTDIVFGAGEYRPHTPDGGQLLAHELTHVAQQAASGEARIQRQPKKDEQPLWQKHMDEILPHLGLVAEIDRFTTLVDALGVTELERVIELIHGNKDARKLVKQHGALGIVAIADTLTRKRLNVPLTDLDLPAAEFLLTHFPTRTRPVPKPTKAPPGHVFPEEAVRDAYVEFHRNSLLDIEDEQKHKIRRNCILIVRDLVPKLFNADPKLAKRISAKLGTLSGGTLTMPHAGAALSDLGVGGKATDIKFKDGNGVKNNPPQTMESSAWDAIIGAVGKDYGWHVFGVSVLSGFHSATVVVDNQPGGKHVYWADQWNIAQGEQYGQIKGAISGFREYDDGAKFDTFIQDITYKWWTTKIHAEDSACAKRRADLKKKDWKTFCQYPGTLRIWHFRTKAK